MRESINIYLILLLCLFSCKESKETIQSAEKQTEIRPPVPAGPVTDFDPYFVAPKATSSRNGPSSITRNILQDGKGNYWLATWEGIIRYDGSSFTNVTASEGLRQYHVFSILEDQHGNLWFGTIGAGVYRYDGTSFANFTTAEGLANDRVTTIYADSRGDLWFCTEGGLSRYDGKSFRNYTTEDGLTANDVNAIIEDASGIMWIGTRGDACLFDPDPKALQAGRSPFTRLTKEDGSPFVNVRSIIEDQDGRVWLGGNDGLWRTDGEGFTQYTTDFTGYIYADKEGNIWTSVQTGDFENWELVRYEKHSLYDQDPAVSNIKPGVGMLFGIMEDRAGNIWFGTLSGIVRYDGKSFEHFRDQNVREQ